MEDTRPSFEAVYMALAVSMSERSTCRRTNSAGELMKVGCAIVTADYRKVLAVGYNGNAAGLPNQCDSDEPGNCGCLHAEENAAIAIDVARGTPKIVFCTHLPCKMCAKRIIQIGHVCRVVYLNDYRRKEGLALFDIVGIEHKQLLEDA